MGSGLNQLGRNLQRALSEVDSPLNICDAYEHIYPSETVQCKSMPLAKRRKVVNEESVAKDAPGNRVLGNQENGEKEQGANDNAKTVAPSTITSSICMTVERRSRHTSRSESEEQSSVVTDGDKKISTPLTPTTTVPLRTSSRVIRKTRKDYSPPESPVKKQTVATAKEAKATTPSTKTKRAWELWSIEDKNVFFEALFEYGKDFDAIQNMLVQRGKRRGLPTELLKRKDQVRFLYYRTWHKITKFVTITKDIRKEAQEIYGLINYGVFRKSIKGLNERTAVKLNDLINKGYTTFKVKGKKKKIKTPVCSALKKINGLVDNKDSQAYQLPERISVEICPRNNRSWSRVQTMSHNPRVKMSLMSDRTLGAILEYLNKKWKSQRERSLSNLDISESNQDILTIFPSKNCKLNQLITMLPQTVPKLDLTLSNYKEHFQFNSPTTNKGKSSTATTATVTATQIAPTTAQSAATLTNVVPTDDQNKPNMEVSSESNSPKVNKINVKLSGEDGPSIISESGPFLEDENAVFPDDLFSNHENKPNPSSVPSDTKPAVTKGSTSESPKQIVNTPPKKANCDETEDSVQDKLQKLYESSKQGWNSETGKTVTLAQLMLMCGKDKKLMLEYDWCHKTVVNDNLTHKLANMLRRLAHLAATEFSDFSSSKSKSHTSKTTACCMCGTVASRSKIQTANKGTNTSRMNRPVKTVDSNTNDSSELASTIIGHDLSVVQCSNQVIANQVPLSPQNGVFRVPMAVPLRHNQPPSHVSQATVSQLIRPPEPKSNFLIPRKRKKQKNKSIIIQRTLLPKTTKDHYSILPTINNNQQPLLTNTTIPLSQPGGVITQPYSPISLNSSLQQAQPSPPIVPIIGIPDNQSPISVPVTQTVSIDTGQPFISQPTSESLSVNIQYDENLQQSILSINNPVTTSTDGLTPLLSSPSKDQIRRSIQQTSPPNLSTLLDMSLPAPSAGDNSTAEKLLDIALVNSNSGFSNFLEAPGKVPVKTEPGLLTPTIKTSTYQGDRSQVSPPASPNPTLLKLGFSASDAQWLNGESQDISLSSFLTETPTKKTTTVQSSIVPPHNIFSEHSQDSLVETSFQSMMNESSMDLVSKFAKLADHIVGPSHDKT